MPPTVQIKRGTAAALASVNPTLLAGELVWDSTNNTLRVGNGSSAYASLSIVSATPSSHTHAASDITSGTLDAARIANDSITYAKLQNVSATDRLLGRSSVGAGDVEEITCTAFGRSLIDDADAASARSTLSVQPTASPAFTGAATVTNDGNVVPLTVTNTGTANSFVVNDESGDTTPFVVDAAGRVVAGGSAPASEAHKVSIVGTLPTVSNQSVGYIQRGTVPSSSTVAMISYSSLAITDAASFTLSSFTHFRALQSAIGAGSSITNQYGFVAHDSLTGATNNYGFYSDIASGTGRWNFYANGTAASFFGGQVQISAGSASACGVAFSGDVNTGLAQIGGADTASLVTAGVERVRVDASGNVGIGAAPGTTLDIQRASADAAVFVQGQTASTGATVQLYSGAGIAYIGTRTNHPLVITTNNTERVRVDASGNVGVGNIVPTHRIDCNGEFRLRGAGASTEAGKLHLYWVSSTNRATWTTDASGNALIETGSSSPAERFRVGVNGRSQFFAANEKYGIQLNKSTTANGPFIGSDGADIFTVSASGGGELLRIDAGGNVLVNTTSGDPAGANVAGCCIAPSAYMSISRTSFPCLYVNRKADDGTIVSIHQDGLQEGSISVSGTTVSYNAFCGSHWAQLRDGSRPAILRGTVLETIDEMCEWPEGKSDRLARVKVSDTPRSRRVYGVFMGWDEDYAATGDMYATALGAYMVRVSGTVQSGDLLESAGDGTARTQSDDIVRSSTIGKVSSTHRVAEYDDGSYLVPCVLMCG